MKKVQIALVGNERPTHDDPVPRLAALPLHKLLLTSAPHAAAAKIDATDVPDLEAYIGQMRLYLVPATDAEIAREVEALFAHYPRPDHSLEIERRRWRDWQIDLAGVPLDLLMEACCLWRNSEQRFAPTPGQLKAPITMMLQTRRALMLRADQVLALVVRPAD